MWECKSSHTYCGVEVKGYGLESHEATQAVLLEVINDEVFQELVYGLLTDQFSDLEFIECLRDFLNKSVPDFKRDFEIKQAVSSKMLN